MRNFPSYNLQFPKRKGYLMKMKISVETKITQQQINFHSIDHRVPETLLMYFFSLSPKPVMETFVCYNFSNYMTWFIGLYSTARKLFENGFFSGPYFPAFKLNMEIYFVNLRIQSESRKMQTRKNSGLGHFSRSAWHDGFIQETISTHKGSFKKLRNAKILIINIM